MHNLRQRISKIEKSLKLNSKEVPPGIFVEADGNEFVMHGTINGRKVITGAEIWTDEEKERYVTDGEIPPGKPLKLEWA